jgi:hypothetical protein
VRFEKKETQLKNQRRVAARFFNWKVEFTNQGNPGLLTLLFFEFSVFKTVLNAFIINTKFDFYLLDFV